MTIFLIILTAIFQILGTTTVAVNYYKTSSTAKAITDRFNPDFSIPFKERDQMNNLIKQLTPRWYLTVGMIAYVLAAVLGVCAGISALYN